MKKKILILFVLFILCNTIVNSQGINIEKIKPLLEKKLEDSIKIKINEYLAECFFEKNYDSAIYYIDRAISLTENKTPSKTKANLLASKTKYLVENGQYDEALQLNNEILSICSSIGDMNLQGKTLVDKGLVFDYLGDYTKALCCYDSALIIANKENNKTLLAYTYNRYGIIYEEMSQFHKAIEYYKKSLGISIEINYEKESKNSFNYLGICYFYLGDYQHSLEYYQKFLDCSEKQNALKDIAFAYGNIGMIYEMIKDYKKALLYYQKSLSIHQQINNKQGIANSLTCIGDINFENGNYKEALKLYMSVLDIAEEINDKRVKAFIYTSIGNAYNKLKMHESAIESYKLSFELCEQLGDISGKAWNHYYLGEVYYDKQNFPLAFKYYKMAYEAAIITGEKEVLKNCSKSLSELYNKKDDFKNAYDFLMLNKAYSDSLFNADKIRDITALSIQYQNTKEREIEELQHQQRDLEFQKKISKQKVFRNSFILGFVFMLIIAFNIFRNLKHKQKLNKILKEQRGEILIKNEELTQMNHEIVLHNEEISKRNNNITGSLKYAQKIQSALFPQEQLFKEYFNDGFVIHRPLEIVSGDFYWMKKIKNMVVVAVADCTGHGVPGAFMSVLGIAYLNEIARDKQNQKTGEVLDKLRIELKQSIDHSEYEADSKDGMDIALCAINIDDYSAQFSGAINNLYIIRNNNLLVYKGDHQHIGIYDEEKAFTNFEIQLEKDDILYMFTDGYVDQFGGKDGRKFLIKHFKQLLLNIANFPLSEQKAILEKTLNDWQKGYQQVDDILVVGVKI